MGFPGETWALFGSLCEVLIVIGDLQHHCLGCGIGRLVYVSARISRAL
jgi:hypothetical protein